MRFRIRIDKFEGDVHFIENRLLTNAREYVWVLHEINDNPHYHLYLDNPNYMSAQSIRYYLRKVLTKSTDYSVKQCDDERVEEYVQYLFNAKHGNVATLIGFKFDPVLLEEAKAKAKQVADEYEAKRKTAKPKSLYDIAMYVHDTTKDDEQLIPNIIQALHKYCKVHDEFLIYKLLCTIQSKRDINLVVERVRRKIL